jgi:hypothetical protein
MKVADTITDAGQTRKHAAEEPRAQHSRWSWMAEAHIAGEGESYAEPVWTHTRAGTIGLQPGNPSQGRSWLGWLTATASAIPPRDWFRTVIVTEARTGERISLRLTSTSLLSLFEQYQPHPGERIDVRYRWNAPDHGYQRWRLLMDRPETLDFSSRWGSVRRGALAPGAARS